MTIDLRKALPGDKCLRHDFVITYYKEFSLTVNRHKFTDGFSRVHDGLHCSDSPCYADITRNLSQEERKAAAAYKMVLGMADPCIFGAALVGSIPVARRCECCGQEVK